MARNKKPVKPRRRRFHGFRFLTVFLAIALGIELVCGAVGLYALQMLLEEKQEVDVDDFNTVESTLIYDMNGTQIADVGTQLRENIVYDQVPESLVDAFLSIEDSRYFEHNGFDIPRFSKAILETVLNGNMQGGSTFTMQLVKLTYFQDDENGTSRTKDIEYKVQQIALAIELEQKSNKKSLFEMYLNKMNFGGIGNIRGVEKAAQQYYGKSVSELNLAESAMLAGVINSPYYYDPHLYLDHATYRRDTVLDMMVYHGYITEEMADLAKTIKVEDTLIDPYSKIDTSYEFQAYIDYVIQEAEEITGQDPLNVSMEIYTAMNPSVQRKMEEIQADKNWYVEFADDLMEIGMISENNQNGEIVAIGGGRNYASGGSMLLNHATDQYKQPGSSIKPIIDYAPAFETLGWATSHVLKDAPLTYGTWTYQNAGGHYYGNVDLNKAIVYSLNIPAIKAMQSVIDMNGYQYYYDMLEKLNYATYDPDLFDIAWAIGGNAFTLSCEELMATHAVLMNGGYYIKPHAITKITYRNGKQDDVVPEYDRVPIVSSSAAYLAAQLMYSAVHTNVGNYLDVLIRDYYTYGKTGTTDWGDSGVQYGIPVGAMKDKWMVAETTQYTTAVWVGYEKAVEGGECYFADWKAYMNIPGKICSEILDSLQEDSWPEPLERPEDVVSLSHVKGIFPYVAITDDVPDDYKTTGLIKREFAHLGSLSVDTQPIASLASFTASANADGSIAFKWSEYPKVEVHNEMGVNYSEWVTGKPTYNCRLSQKGHTIAEISSEDPSKTQKVDALEPDTETQACAFYQYSKSKDTSNEVCITFRTAEEEKKPEKPDDDDNEDGNDSEEPVGGDRYDDDFAYYQQLIGNLFPHH